MGAAQNISTDFLTIPDTGWGLVLLSPPRCDNRENAVATFWVTKLTGLISGHVRRHCHAGAARTEGVLVK